MMDLYKTAIHPPENDLGRRKKDLETRESGCGSGVGSVVAQRKCGRGVGKDY